MYGTYHHRRICYPSDHVEFGLEGEGEVAENAAEQVDRHESDRYPDDFAVLVYLVVLWAWSL